MSDSHAVPGRLHQDPVGKSFAYFILAILGFSFWFLMAVPFASHRETYAWLAGTTTRTLAEQMSFGVSSTYRPLSQGFIWLLFVPLEAAGFPTSQAWQTALQGAVYASFVLGWWLIFEAAPQRRLFALIALVAGAVLFSGYIHLFHIYGLMYVPVILTLGACLYWRAKGVFDERALWFAPVAILLTLWHPIAPALFVSCYFGLYLEKVSSGRATRHLVPLAVMAVCSLAVVTAVVLFPRDQTEAGSKLAGFLASYRTNEVNAIVSAVVAGLAFLTVLSMKLGGRLQMVAQLGVVFALGLLAWSGLPLLFVWFGVVLLKLFRLRSWSLLVLMLATMALPFGGATGTPIHTLFAIVVATYVTAYNWPEAEQMLVFITPRYALGAVAAAMVVVGVMRLGIEIPLVTRFATPLLAERERTYQLEQILDWLHRSPYCGVEVAFVDNAGSPVDSLESAIDRRHRPPAAIQDVRRFWDAALRCEKENRRAAVVTFGGPNVTDEAAIYQISGKYAGRAAVTINLAPVERSHPIAAR